jgi:hypothetical protein
VGQRIKMLRASRSIMERMRWMEDTEEAGGMEGGEQSDHVELLAGKHIHIRAREG